MPNKSQQDYQQIQEKIEERFNQRTEFIMHFVAYVFINIAMHIAANVFESIEFNYILIISTVWGAGLVMHGIQVVLETSVWVRAKQRAIQEEIELELYYKEGRVPSFVKKRKNEGEFEHLRIGYDGELVSVDEAEEFAQQEDYQD